MNEQEQLETFRNAVVGLGRARINQLLNSLGLRLSDGTASLTSIVVFVFLGLNVLFALNVAFGLLLGEWLGSLGFGFLLLAACYLVLSLLYMGLRSRVERGVQTRVARGIHHRVDNLNASLNQVELLRPVAPYREAFISGEPQPYHALGLRRDEAKRQAARANGDLQEGVQYLRRNYAKVFGYVAQRQIPAVAYLSPIMNLLGGTGKTSTQARASHNTIPRVVSLLENKIEGLRPYTPYLLTAYNYLSPLVSSFVIGKTQGWLLSKLFGRKKSK